MSFYQTACKRLIVEDNQRFGRFVIDGVETRFEITRVSKQPMDWTTLQDYTMRAIFTGDIVIFIENTDGHELVIRGV